MARGKIDPAIGRATQFNGDTAAKMGKKGAAACAEAKRRKKTMAEIASIIAESPISPKNAKLKKQLSELGLSEENGEMLNESMLVAAVFSAALSGDMKAVEQWQDWTGQANGQTVADNAEDDPITQSLKEQFHAE